MIDRDEPIRQCYAFNRDGKRCDMPGGHPGNHSITIVFTDDDLWEPAAVPAMLASIPVQQPDVEHFTAAPPDYSNAKCFCEHPYHGKEICGVPDANDVPCDCSNSIPL